MTAFSVGTVRFTAPPNPRVPVWRERELEQVALLATKLAWQLRDDNPALVWLTLLQLTPQQLRELVVAALAMVPVDLPMSSLLAWVEAIGA